MVTSTNDSSNNATNAASTATSTSTPTLTKEQAQLQNLLLQSTTSQSNNNNHNQTCHEITLQEQARFLKARNDNVHQALEQLQEYQTFRCLYLNDKLDVRCKQPWNLCLPVDGNDEMMEHGEEEEGENGGIRTRELQGLSISDDIPSAAADDDATAARSTDPIEESSQAVSSKQQQQKQQEEETQDNVKIMATLPQIVYFYTPQELQLFPPTKISTDTDANLLTARDGTLLCHVMPALLDISFVTEALDSHLAAQLQLQQQQQQQQENNASGTTTSQAQTEAQTQQLQKQQQQPWYHEYTIRIATYLDTHLPRTSTTMVTILIDVRAGLGWPNPPALQLLSFLRHLSTTLNQMYPERLKKCVLYPLPRGAVWIWNLVKKFMDEDTAGKIVFVKGSAGVKAPLPVEELKEYVGVEVLEGLVEHRRGLFVD